MLKHYLVMALRHFRRHKLTTTLNIVCLSIGLACFLGIHGIVTYFQSSDRHFENSQRIYTLTEQVTIPGSGFSIPASAYTDWIAAEYLKADFPQLEYVARATPGSERPVVAGSVQGFVHVTYADPEFLEVFRLPFIDGDSRNALRTTNGVVITEAAAQRLFGGTREAMGRSVILDNRDELIVTGVIASVPQPSHMGVTAERPLRFDMLVSMAVIERDAQQQRRLNSWNSQSSFTYMVLPADASMSVESLRQELKAFGARHVPPTACKCEFGAAHVSELRLGRIDILLGADKTGISTVTLLYVLAALVLIVSCINYANLSTAQGMSRTKEVGMRRVVGARRGHVIAQAVSEVGLLVLIALLISVAGCMSIVSLTSASAGETLGVVVSAPEFWIGLAALVCIVSVASAAYPALVLSAVSPIQAVRAGRVLMGKRFLPRLLVGVQFATASFLVIAILIMQRQNAELERSIFADSGDPFVVINNDITKAGIDFDVLQAELLAQPHVQAVTAANGSPWRLNCIQEIVTVSAAGAARRWPTCSSWIDDKYFETLGQSLLAGRLFDRSRADDIGPRPDESTNRVPNIVIDADLARQYGWPHPQGAIGKTMFLMQWRNFDQPPRPLNIIGVVETRRHAAVGLGATSSMYAYRPDIATTPVIRISKANIAEALAQIDAVWSKLAPDSPLKRQFADEVQNQNHSLFSLISAVVGAIATLALMIAVLGLIGMSIHVIGRRTHEIGVRKTLGASVLGIITLLLKDFSKPVVIANVIAWPLGFLAMQAYLSVFTQRTELTLLPFAVSLAIIVLVAWIAVAAQAMRAARLKPATVLRYE